MNEVFETLADVFEELRSESEDREYSVQTEDAKAASRELKKKQKAFEAYLSKLPKEDREFLEDYMDTVDRSFCQILCEFPPPGNGPGAA